MKVTIKKVPEQLVHEIDLSDGEITVLQLKELVGTKHRYDVASQKMIFNGKLLPNDVKLSAQKIEDGATIVLIAKPTDEPQPQVAEDKSAPQQESQTQKIEVKAQEPTVPPELVEQLTAMGFEADQVIKALSMSNNNVEQAANLILSGAPLGDSATEQPARAPSQSDDLPMEEAARLINTLVTRMQDERPENELEWALRQPQFQRIKTAIQKNSEMLFPLLEQLGRVSPELMQLIGDNQAEFMDWVNDEAPQLSFGAPVQNFVAGVQARQQELSQADEASLTRLMGLGFTREQVKQAFLACGRNEDAAANYLFDM